MSQTRILVIEDDPDIQDLLRFNLEKEGYEVQGFESGEKGLDHARSTVPDLILLDLMLPGLDGLRVSEILKRDRKTRDIPVVMLTARGEEEDVVRGLEAGADDYVTKPFSPRILLARITAVLRRSAPDADESQEIVEIHDFKIDPVRHHISWRDEPLMLTSTEFRFIHHLALHPGWVFTRSQIVQAIHGHDYPVTDRSIDVLVVGLRKKLGDAGVCVETVRGVGYRFME